MTLALGGDGDVVDEIDPILSSLSGSSILVCFLTVLSLSCFLCLFLIRRSSIETSPTIGTPWLLNRAPLEFGFTFSLELSKETDLLLLLGDS